MASTLARWWALGRKDIDAPLITVCTSGLCLFTVGRANRSCGAPCLSSSPPPPPLFYFSILLLYLLSLLGAFPFLEVMNILFYALSPKASEDHI